MQPGDFLDLFFGIAGVAFHCDLSDDGAGSAHYMERQVDLVLSIVALFCERHFAWW
jgi:hypothetical protein